MIVEGDIRVADVAFLPFGASPESPIGASAFLRKFPASLGLRRDA
jgi:hypothetical protein